MNDDDLRRAVREHAAGGEPPVGFVESVVDALPDRDPPRMSFSWVVAAAAMVVISVAVAAWSTRTPVAGPQPVGSPASSSSPSAAAIPSSTPAAGLPHAVDEEVVLSIEVTPGGAVPPDGAGPPGSGNDVIFRLTAAGRVDYADMEPGGSLGVPRVAYLTDDQIDGLVAWAMGPGGIVEADTLYDRPSFGPSGMTIITLQSDPLTKQIVYELGPGNLMEDTDPALGKLPELVGRLSSFSDAVEAGEGVGGHTAADDDVARSVALSDRRFDALLESPFEVVRVLPDPTRPENLFVEISVEREATWPELVVCEIGGADGPATGVMWLVDVEEREVAAVSPVWGDVSCLTPAVGIQWVEGEWVGYSYVLESSCGLRGMLGRFRIRVRDGVVAEVEGLDEAGRRVVTSMPPAAFPTMTGLLEVAAEARASGAESVSLATDPTDGHPVTLEIDWILAAIDDEECYAVSELVREDE